MCSKEFWPAALPKDAITARVAAGTLTIVEVDPRARWNR